MSFRGNYNAAVHLMFRCCASFSMLLLTVAVACAQPSHRQDVRIASGDVSLAGTVIGPATSDRHPALVLLHGSGPDGRQNAYYEMLAEAFARRGFVVLIYDKRGVGGSTGDWQRSPFSALVDDAAAAARSLRQHPWVDSTRVGLWGGSEGAGIAPEVALRVPGLAFVIMQSAAGVTFAQQNLHQTELQLRNLISDSAIVRAAMHLQRLKHNYAHTESGWSEYENALRAAAGTPYAELLGGPTRRDNWWWAWYRTKMAYSPIPALARLRIPVLAIWGESDALIPVQENLAAVAAARRGLAIRGDSLVVLRAPITFSASEDYADYSAGRGHGTVLSTSSSWSPGRSVRSDCLA